MEGPVEPPSYRPGLDRMLWHQEFVAGLAAPAPVSPWAQYVRQVEHDTGTRATGGAVVEVAADQPTTQSTTQPTPLSTCQPTAQPTSLPTASLARHRLLGHAFADVPWRPLQMRESTWPEAGTPLRAALTRAEAQQQEYWRQVEKDRSAAVTRALTTTSWYEAQEAIALATDLTTGWFWRFADVTVWRAMEGQRTRTTVGALVRSGDHDGVGDLMRLLGTTAWADPACLEVEVRGTSAWCVELRGGGTLEMPLPWCTMRDAAAAGSIPAVATAAFVRTMQATALRRLHAEVSLEEACRTTVERGLRTSAAYEAAEAAIWSPYEFMIDVQRPQHPPRLPRAHGRATTERVAMDERKVEAVGVTTRTAGAIKEAAETATNKTEAGANPTPEPNLPEWFREFWDESIPRGELTSSLDPRKRGRPKLRRIGQPLAANSAGASLKVAQLASSVWPVAHPHVTAELEKGRHRRAQLDKELASGKPTSGHEDARRVAVERALDQSAEYEAADASSFMDFKFIGRVHERCYGQFTSLVPSDMIGLGEPPVSEEQWHWACNPELVNDFGIMPAARIFISPLAAVTASLEHAARTHAVRLLAEIEAAREKSLQRSRQRTSEYEAADARGVSFVDWSKVSIPPDDDDDGSDDYDDDDEDESSGPPSSPPDDAPEDPPPADDALALSVPTKAISAPAAAAVSVPPLRIAVAVPPSAAAAASAHVVRPQLPAPAAEDGPQDEPQAGTVVDESDEGVSVPVPTQPPAAQCSFVASTTAAKEVVTKQAAGDAAETSAAAAAGDGGEGRNKESTIDDDDDNDNTAGKKEEEKPTELPKGTTKAQNFLDELAVLAKADDQPSEEPRNNALLSA